MLHLLIHKITIQKTRGFTLVELLAIIIIVGILCALATPSFLAMQGVAKLNSSVDNVRTALETSQFQAIKKNQTCTVYIPDTEYTPNRSGQIVGNCIINGNAINPSTANGPIGLPLFYLDTGITVTNNPTTATPQQVVYNPKGLTQNTITIVLSSNETSDQRCLIVNQGVGLIRGGKKYVATNTPPCEVTE